MTDSARPAYYSGMSATHKATLDYTGVQRRYFELRYEGDRIVSGTAIRYGDIAKFPWGGKEKFAPGAFGSVTSKDIIINVQHDRGCPVARSGGGGLELSDDGNELHVRAEMVETTDGNDALALVRKKILRGFSVEFLPLETRKEDGITVIEKADLRNIAIVDRPAYKGSRLTARAEGSAMTTEPNTPDMKAEIETAVTAALEKRSKADKAAGSVDTAALSKSLGDVMTRAVAEAVKTQVATQVAGALKERDEAVAAEERAKNEMADKEKKAKEDKEMMDKKADSRAELLMMIKPLLPEGTEIRGKTNMELLVLAAGDEVKDAEKRSEDYLLAKVEGIIERRDAAAGGRTATNEPVQDGGNKPAGGGGGFSITRLIEQRRARGAK